MSAGTVDAQRDAVAPFRLGRLARLRRKVQRWRQRRLRRIHKEDAELLRRVETEDATLVDSDARLPRTLEEALPEDPEERAKDERAIVVTQCTGSYCMVGCNSAWENLCGYAESEIIGKDSSILQGPDTNHQGLQDAIQRLFEEEKPVRCITTNYTKSGKSFKNLLTLGPIYDAKGKMTHFVAVLKDIGKSPSPNVEEGAGKV